MEVMLFSLQEKREEEVREGEGREGGRREGEGREGEGREGEGSKEGRLPLFLRELQLLAYYVVCMLTAFLL